LPVNPSPIKKTWSNKGERLENEVPLVLKSRDDGVVNVEAEVAFMKTPINAPWQGIVTPDNPPVGLSTEKPPLSVPLVVTPSGC
jgi:hypothetical protein